ncbi:MAG TPA: NADPH-dependent FMN reductase [Flavobacteriales bacterium]|nr:NADPH-dependent FMN reductase [Flavobacteriales bacterium]
MHFIIISSSVREGRASNRVATFFKNYIESGKLGTAEILDLKTCNFPLFEERLKFQKNPLPSVLEFAEKIRSANGVIIVTPEYNGGYPASLKNVIDLLTEDWKRKPIAISTVSAGAFGGSQVITSLQFSLWKIGAIVVPAMFPVPNVDKSFDGNGVPADKEATEKRAEKFIGELKWFMEAKNKMMN